MKDMMRKLLVLTGGLLTAATIFAQDISVRVYRPSAGLAEFTAVLDTVSSSESQTAAARTFQKKYPNDVTVQTMVANVLALDNLDATRAYYRDLAAGEPDNVAANYLAGRLNEKASDRRAYADKILAKDPDSYWGNLLLALSLMKTDDPSSDQAEAALRKAIAKDNSLPPAVEELGKLLQAKAKTEEADRVFVKLGEMLPDKFGPVRYRMMLTAGDQLKAMKLVDDYLKKNPKDTEALNTKAAGSRELKDWDGYVATMQKLVGIQRSGENSYNLACAFSLAGKPDSSYAWLTAAADLGFNDIEQFKNDEDLVPLHSDSRWSELLAKVEDSQKTELNKYMQKMARTAPQRKEKAVNERGTDMAEDFELKDLNGKTVKLSALRGKVVILDFWATWCGPCKRTMPLLDKFYTDQRPKDVEIYGVNVWERGSTDGVKPFIEKSGYHFPILYGTSDLAKAYGVQGIPTLVVIDQKGKLAYRHVGYDPTIPEVLAWQTKELLK
jgi:thiol-disulfide isomerase/thioredoxin